MGFFSSQKSILQTILHLRIVSARASGALGGNDSHFKIASTISPGSLYWCNYVEKYGDFANFKLPSLNRFIHATGSYRSVERDYYDILGISSDANHDEIENAFHALAKKFQHDANWSNPSSKRKFQEISDAYETLQNPEKKAQYDRMRESSGTSKTSEYPNWDGGHSRYARRTHFSGSFHKIFAEIFEDETENMAADIKVELALTFSEAAKGCTKNLSFGADVPCDSCEGVGHPVGAEPKLCLTCRGSGIVKIPPFATTCSACKGSGKTIKTYCLACRGSGLCEGVKDVKVTIPAGVDSGDTITVPKAGNAGGWGRSPSNLFIELKVAEDLIFSRQGADIYVEKYISFTQAILGDQVEIPTLSGNIQLQIPKGVQPGDLVSLRGKGLPKYGFLMNHGDQYVRFRIKFPTTVTEKQRALLEEFEEQFFDGGYVSAENSWWQCLLQSKARPKFILEFSIFTLILLFLNKFLN